MEPILIQPSLFEQTILVITVFGVKPLYMLLALVLIKLLWRSRDRDLRLLLAALIGFEAGEIACALNYGWTAGTSDLLEFGHQAGMIAFSGLLPWSMFSMLDDRVLRYSAVDKTCAAYRFCGCCWKREDVGCGLHRLFLFGAPALALVALLPLPAPIPQVDLILPVFGTDVIYRYSPMEQWAVFRGYPMAAAIALLATFGLLLRGQHGLAASQWTFFGGLGLMGFSMLRFFLLSAFDQMPIWADTFEELTELITVVGIAVLLWVFRRSFWPRRDSGSTATVGG